MKTIIVACKTLENELRFAMEKTGTTFPVRWIESGLHNVPDFLACSLQRILDRVEAQRVLIAMGLCGHFAKGIRAGRFELIIPRADDCISLLLGSTKARNKISAERAAYFLTEGWLRGERNMWEEYRCSLEKYGEEQAQEIASMMIGSYRSLALLDNGIDPIDPLIEKVRVIAETLKLEQIVIPATTEYLEQLLTGPWPDDKFLVKARGESITAEDLYLTLLR